MGRLASTAVAAVAPEAKAAAAVAGKAAGGRGRPAPAADPRVTRPGSAAARQRQAVEDVKAARPAPPPTSSGDGADPVADAGSPPAPVTPAPVGPSLPSLPGASPGVQTGSGFLLGLFLWGWVGLPYLRGGASEVRRTLAAKFLNKTGG